MIPVLHPAESTSWASFGLGALSDAISCDVTEERNGLYELEMTYPVSGQHYADLALRRIILAKPNFTDNPQPFRIYNISKPLNGIVTVSAQHLCYDLSGYVVGAFSAIGIQSALAALTANCTPSPCPFRFSSDMSAGGTMEVVKPTSIRALMGGTEGSILNYWHGEWSYNGFSCQFSANRGEDRGVTIRYGKNLTSIRQEENNASVYTGIYPFWYNQDTKAIVTLTEKTISVPGSFGYTKICPVDLSDRFESEPTEAQLRTAAQAYISSHDIGVPAVNLQLSFVQLEEIKERVDLCDTVHVYFDTLGVNASAKCVRTRWDVLAERYSSIELGSIRTSIARTIAEIKDTADQAHAATSTLADTARSVSQKITGQMGGYVVMNDTDNDGQPDEILIMDSPDKETAVNIIRMNNGGIAFSQDGYDGTYGTAWSIDGQFVADYITSGVLQANLIRILGTTNFYWDAGNIYIINPQDQGQQIRIGQYDGTRYGIGFTRDGGVTWQTAMDFQGLNVSATGFSKTYISLMPPEPEDYGLESFNVGDVWVESERRYSWDEVSEHKWTWAAQHTWQELGGATEPCMYTWNGGSWQKVYDGESFTSFDSRLTVAENNIAAAVASVATKGTTYVQLTDPRNNEGITVNLGDHWVKADPGHDVLTWNRADSMTWNELAANYDWDSTEGAKEYAWDGYEWVLVSDHGAEVRHTTAIIETDKKITLMATAQTEMNDQLVENTAQLTIQANQIASEVAQRKAGETEMSSLISQNAGSISSEVTRAKTAEGTLQSKTKYLQTSGRIQLDAFTEGASGTAMGVLTKAGISIDGSGKINIAALTQSAQNAINKAAGITVDGDGKIVLSAMTKTVQNTINKAAGITVDGSGKITISALTQNAQNAINKAADITVDSDGKILLSALAKGVYEERSGIEITSSGISLSASKNLTVKSGSEINIKSGGKFVISSENFNITKNGNVSMTGSITSNSGTIAGWEITSSGIRRLTPVSEGTATTQYGAFVLSQGSSISSGSSAFLVGYRAWDGSSYGGWTYPFKVDYGGHLYATSATIKGAITVDSISFSNGVTLNGSNLTDGTVSYGKHSPGVKTSLDNGDNAKDTVTKLMAGQIAAGKLYTNQLVVDGSMVVYQRNYHYTASWQSKTIDGTTIHYLGR